MSVIWDLLRDVRISNREDRRMAEPYPSHLERRQSPRISTYVPVFVYGYNAAGEPFSQPSNTLQVNANGGLFDLEVNLRYGQNLLVTNRLTGEEQECYVVTLLKRPRHSGLRVGVAFRNSAPGFWARRPA